MCQKIETDFCVILTSSVIEGGECDKKIETDFCVILTSSVIEGGG